jgi:Tol biopolymer transport system component
MKLIRTLLITAALAAPLPAQTPGAVALRAAIETETVKGDLRAALQQYADIAARYAKSDRAAAASALLHMAECHAKMGDAEARKIYERILRDFGDQKDAAEVARKKMAENSSRNSGVQSRTVWSNSYSWGSVSPDGRYVSIADKATGDLTLRDLVTGTERHLTNHTAGAKREFSDFSIFSPDGKQVAYVWYNSADPGFELRLITTAPGGTPKVLFQNREVRYPGPWAWSADGKWIAVQLQRKDRTVQIALLSPADGSHRVLKSVGWGGAGSMAFSPDSRFLAYNTPSDQNPRTGDIFVLATDGSAEYPAVQYPNSRNTPVAWTPDGSHLLFLSDRTGPMSLWAVPMEGGKAHGTQKLVRTGINGVWGITRAGALYHTVVNSGTEVVTASVDLRTGKLTSPPTPEFIEKFPARWSPDGKFLAHGVQEAAPATFSRIRIQSLASGQARELRPQLRYINEIAWAPDARSFAAAGADLKGRHGIFRIDVQTGEVEAIVIPGETAVVDGVEGESIAMQPRFLAGGSRLLYKKNFRKQGDAAVSESRLIERDLASGAEREFPALHRLAPGLPFASSPDGKWLAYQSRNDAGKVSAIHLLPMDGGEPRELLRASAPQSLELCDWTPSGQDLIVRKVLDSSDQGELWIYPAFGGEPRKLAVDAPRAQAVSVHPDGTRIAYTVRTEGHREVLVLENFLASLAR